MIETAMIASQAIWSITPGKWLCRLRTVRSTLRPCGFAASLTREILLFVETAYGLWWVPDVISIA